MNRPEPNPAQRRATRTRIQSRNREIIVRAALEVFSTYGYRGTTLDQIAGRAGMSKPNLLYYFPRKEEVYVAVLEETLTEWLEPLTRLDEAGDPVDEIRNYIVLKLKMSHGNPAASRLFANEILHGAPSIGGFLAGPLRSLLDEKSAIIGRWIAEGRLAAVDPRHLIITIWAVTQHYADFDVQIRAVLGEGADPIPDAEPTILSILLNGLRPR